MATPTINLSMTRGDTQFFDVDITKAGVPENPSTGSLWFMVKAAYSDLDAAAKISKALAAGITVVDATNGKCRIQIDSADTSAFPAEILNYVYDIQYKDAAARVWTIAKGTFTIYPDVRIAIT